MSTQDAKAGWEENGFLILPKFYGKRTLDRAVRVTDRSWTDRPDRIVVDDLNTGQRCRMVSVSLEDRTTHRFKLNDLFLEYDEIRALALNERLTPILREVLGDAPVLCNSLSFQQGSGQPDHVDAIYMTPRTLGNLTAIWVALEDCHPDAGPLNYYPGSHQIPQYRFSNGSYHHVADEMPSWRAYMQDQIQQRGLQAKQFAAKRGDVFIWHAHLVHGGSAIKDSKRTRRSLVCHYYTEADCRAMDQEIIPFGQGYWLRRSPQAANGEQPIGPPSLRVDGGHSLWNRLSHRLRSVSERLVR